MKTITLGHLFLDVTTNKRCDQWSMSISNNGVVIASTYGRLLGGLVPSDENLKWRAAFAVGPRGRGLPHNVWG